MTELYPDLSYPPAPPERPYVLVNMVATLDGKIISGERDEPVADLGSSLDHETMRVIEASCQGVMIGSGSLRATPGLCYPNELLRFVVSGRGQVDPTCRFFTDSPQNAFVVTHALGAASLPVDLQYLAFGASSIDWEKTMSTLRKEIGIERLLIEGGSELNATLFQLDLVDELFLTLAPKVKLGRETPTIADGEPLPRHKMRLFTLISCQPRGNEVFLRYRRTSEPFRR